MPEVPAARNALRVLRALAGRSVPVPASTLARELGIPRSSLYQLARAMMDEGFVVHYPEERAYGLSALVSEIGSGSLQTDRLRRMAHPLMERLAASSAIPLVCHLAVLTGAEVTYVDRVSGPRAPTTVSSIGVRLPAHLAATGRSSLAVLPHEQVRALYPHRDALIRRVGPGPDHARRARRTARRRPALAAGRSRRATSRSDTPRWPPLPSIATAIRSPRSVSPIAADRMRRRPPRSAPRSARRRTSSPLAWPVASPQL